MYNRKTELNGIGNILFYLDYMKETNRINDQDLKYLSNQALMVMSYLVKRDEDPTIRWDDIVISF